MTGERNGKRMFVSAQHSSMFAYYSEADAIKMLSDAGFDAISYDFHANERFYSRDRNPEELVTLRKIAEDNGMFFNQSHAPFRHPGNESEMNKYIDDIIQSIKFSSLLGAKIIVVHPLKFISGRPETEEAVFETNMEFYNKFTPYCEEYGVKVALENMWQYKDCLGTKAIVHSTCSKPAEFVKYLDALDNDCFVGCLDIGHALLVREDPAEFIRILGNKYLKALHVHDVNGFVDTHTLPYCGGMGDWDCISQALYDIGYGGEFTFEAGNFIKILPKELMPTGLKMMAEVGNYIAAKASR